jgi:hypothetical protein
MWSGEKEGGSDIDELRSSTLAIIKISQQRSSTHTSVTLYRLKSVPSRYGGVCGGVLCFGSLFFEVWSCVCSREISAAF